MTTKPITTAERIAFLVDVAEIAARHSKGRLRLVCGEADASERRDREAARFLKLDGCRVGRDLELYAFMMSMAGEAYGLADFIEGVLLPIKAAVPEAYRRAAEHCKVEGRRFIPAEHAGDWNELF